MPPPAHPKIYHILHWDRLPSIIAKGGLLCDAEIARLVAANPDHGMGTTIGMGRIKQRRRTERTLNSHPGLYVGQCVPFYFSPRSVMLSKIYYRSEELAYRGGQAPIVHLEADLRVVVAWADDNNRRWAFTLSNAGSNNFKDRAALEHLDEIDWDAVQSRRWSGSGISPSLKEGKQAEFLVERSFPWELVARIGVHSQPFYEKVMSALQASGHKPDIEVKPDWYYPDGYC